MPENKYTFLRKQTKWENLWFYQKSDVLYQMTVVFCRRFLPAYGDRTVDQMVQAARSGKQNIVEGSADGVTSTELEAKLLNVARASIKELREDYVDFLKSHSLKQWPPNHPRYSGMNDFCKRHNKLEDYEPFFERWNEEEFSNAAITLCCMVDTMMQTYLKKKEQEFVAQGGIKERMTAARIGYRTSERDALGEARSQIQELKEEIARLRQENGALKRRIAALEEREDRGDRCDRSDR